MPDCNKCQRPIAAQTPIASFENRTYHPDCLQCKHCKKSVSGQKFLKDKNQDIICEDCDLKYGPVCNCCHKNFKPGESYKKLDENTFYHYTCFTCFGPCRKPIESEFYELDNNQFICTECFDKYGARTNYDDLVRPNKSNHPAPVVEAVMGSRPLSNNDRKKDYDADSINKLSSNFSNKLNTSSSINDANNSPLEEIKSNTNSRKSRFDTSPKSGASESKSALVCEKCKQPIQGTYSVYNDNNYHTKCFTCNRCNTEFKGRQFFKIDGFPVCTNCHEENLLAVSSKCKKCKKSILDTVLTFMNEEYHESCLVCFSCSRKLVGLSIYCDKEKNPYCAECFTKKEAKRCAKCSKAILPNQSNIIFEDQPYHKECFTCDSCKRQIGADESFFKNDNDDTICTECSSNSTF